MAYQVRAGLAVAQFFSGRTEAIDDMKRALANAEAIGDDYTVASVAAALGEAYTQLGDSKNQEVSRHRPGLLPSQRHAAYLARTLQSLVYWYEQQDRGAEAEQAQRPAD